MYEPDKGFGSQKPNKITLGGPYEFKPDRNPGPGTYDAEGSFIKTQQHSKSYS
jgi:hypothetical protein